MVKLIHIEGIGVKFSQLLQEAGIDRQSHLLDVCASRKGRDILAEKTGISVKLILKWTNQADLARINGIGEEYAELLERTGVDSMKELALRNPESLCSMISEINQRIHLVRHAPGLSQIEQWIDQAKSLPPLVSQ